MSTILAYGDSNTWGYEPGTGNRFPPSIRWPGRLQQLLGDSVRIIEQGLNGRTINQGNANQVPSNGMAYLLPCLMTHAPIDLVVLMLGTNDMGRPQLTAHDIAQDMEQMIQAIQNTNVGHDDQSPAILLLAPPPASVECSLQFAPFVNKARELAECYHSLANRYRIDWLDVGTVIQSSAIDGIHFDAPAHTALATALAPRVRAILDRIASTN
ncbi:GDSL-type esterase/lipase family protein [Tuwongella immobilis]|uniref:SGNH hydrolase-type esterase domain-containing protein n=1 Tax=Tuwongella immobilis TaxID=692036 RepID=A0A6C2YSJ0_9BACT|nr:GDSL-type esterase/lipase family protein [Tuwongella immobilis]VIP04324.1 Lipolytic enzyme, G-D-S-L OS=bacterium UASB14 GN=U14_03828 PE=4 SV=1: Lipase_GDSL_2 [Tuwongella immobilis]VTS06010.1 Lipolytic enzyme, G-D-S-L OS=bacterium UASB14 GN=U14_03828 PE=4 SV=1: Lipase_GDSL_2 [Tuwongella immobilis]